jgi:anti-sigma factor RsiW
MGDVVSFMEGRHREVQLLIPWFVMGQLDFPDRMAVEKHLDHCEECRCDVEQERLLAKLVVHAPADPGESWKRLHVRLAQAPEKTPEEPLPMRRMPPTALVPTKRVGWLVGAQVAILLVIGGVVIKPQALAPQYRALGDTPVVRPGNAIVMYDPGKSEMALRQLLQAHQAQLIGGPTAAGAYIVRVPEARRTELLQEMRQDRHVLLAEPLDRGAGR